VDRGESACRGVRRRVAPGVRAISWRNWCDLRARSPPVPPESHAGKDTLRHSRGASSSRRRSDCSKGVRVERVLSGIHDRSSHPRPLSRRRHRHGLDRSPRFDQRLQPITSRHAAAGHSSVSLSHEGPPPQRAAPAQSTSRCELLDVPFSTIRGTTRDGRFCDIARNAKSGGELAGICTCPDGRALFASLQIDALTPPNHRALPRARRSI
jgi:hypothetical protein